MEVRGRQVLACRVPPVLPFVVVRSEILPRQTAQSIKAVGRCADHDTVLRWPLPSQGADQEGNGILISDFPEVEKGVVRCSYSVADNAMTEEPLVVCCSCLPPSIISI